MIGFGFTPDYEGPEAQRERVLGLFDEQMRMMDGLVPESLAHLVEGVTIRAEEVPDDDGLSMDTRYVAEFDTVPDEDVLTVERGFSMPGHTQGFVRDERRFLPPGFYVALSEAGLDDYSPETLIDNIWHYVRDNGIGQREALGTYPMGKVILDRLSTFSMGKPLSDEEKRELIPKANGSTGYFPRANVEIITVPYDDERRSMTDMWYECEPQPDMSAGEMAQRISEVIVTGMANQLSEQDLSPEVAYEVGQLEAYQAAVARAAMHSTNHSILNRGKYTYYGIPQKLFGQGPQTDEVVLDQAGLGDLFDDGAVPELLGSAQASMRRFRDYVLKGEDVYDPSVQETTRAKVRLQVFATSYIRPRIVNGQVFI